MGRVGDFQFDLAKWLKEQDFMQGKQRSQCFNMGKTLNKEKTLSALLSAACRKIWEDAKKYPVEKAKGKITKYNKL